MSPNLFVTRETDTQNREYLSLAIKCYVSSLPNSFSCVKFIVTTGKGETNFGRRKGVYREKTIENYSVTVNKKLQNKTPHHLMYF